MQSPDLHIFNGDLDRDSTIPANESTVIPAMQGYMDSGELDWASALLLGDFAVREDLENFTEKETGLMFVLHELFGGFTRGSMHRLMNEHRNPVEFAREVHTRDGANETESMHKVA